MKRLNIGLFLCALSASLPAWPAPLDPDCAAAETAAAGVRQRQAREVRKQAEEQAQMIFPNRYAMPQKTYSEEEKLNAAALAVDYWRLAGAKGLKDNMMIVAMLAWLHKRGVPGVVADSAQHRALRDYAKAIAQEKINNYSARKPIGSPTTVVMPSGIPDQPDAALAAWAAQRIQPVAGGLGDEQVALLKYCRILAAVGSGHPVPAEEMTWAADFERGRGGHPPDEPPPRLRQALSQGEVLKRQQEEARRQREEALRETRLREQAAAARRAEIEQREWAWVQQVIKQAKADKHLSQSELELLCRHDAALCQRAEAVERYSQCMANAASDAGAYYGAAVRSGNRPSDGTWSGTFRQIERQYEAACQRFRPAGYRGR